LLPITCSLFKWSGFHFIINKPLAKLSKLQM
jgi:hypothetical protein